jgi:hypothetical protein
MDSFSSLGVNRSDTRRYREDLQRSPAGSVPQDDRHWWLDTALVQDARRLINIDHFPGCAGAGVVDD